MLKYSVLTYLIYFRYTKYLYPYECKQANLSSPSELQCAIEGNKREGRTSSYHPYSGVGHPFQTSPLPPSMGGIPPLSLMSQMGMPLRPMHMNGNRPPGPIPPPPPGEKRDICFVLGPTMCCVGPYQVLCWALPCALAPLLDNK